MKNKPQINEKQFLKDLESLRQIGLQADGAVHRVGYSPADSEARAWLMERFRDMGIEPTVDTAGNTLAYYPGDGRVAPIGIGSHSDTVPFGGAYDGALGVVAALAVIEALYTADVRLNHPLEWINFAAEEATMGGGTTGSQAMTGIFNSAVLDKAAWDGKLVREHVAAAGFIPEKMLDATRAKGSFAAFLELHIEQNNQLEKTNRPIAIVDGFVGIRRYGVRFDGTANHAGTTPMATRDDALVMAAPMIRFVRDLAVELGIVGTIGDFKVYPGAPNVIPDRVEMIVEIRGLDVDVLDQAQAIIQKEAESLGGSFDPVVIKPPVTADAIVQDAIGLACAKLHLETLTMSSGAGHDAMNMSLLCPQGMFFVPSKDGISHSKDEFTSAADCVNGAQVMLETVIELDKLLSKPD
ncbi:MAG: N-carbamoyl-L-amino-acid hydrolase [Cellvibrionaceae bacterium]|jgi:N-carbamoyl-L-amino-acid hydrolase